MFFDNKEMYTVAFPQATAGFARNAKISLFSVFGETHKARRC